ANRGGAARRHGTEWIIPAENMDTFREAMTSYLRDNTGRRAMMSPEGTPVVHSPASTAAVAALDTNRPTSTGDVLRAIQATLDPADPRSRVINRLQAMGATAPVQALGAIDPSGFSYELAGSTVDGYYNSRTGEVFVNPNAPDVAHTMLHEATHAALDARLESDSKFRTTIEGIQLEFEATGEAVNHSLAAVDTHEFLAEALSSPPLQKALQRKTLWQKFVAAARRALRVAPGPDTTALGRIMEAIDSAPDFDGPGPGAGVNRAMATPKDMAKEGKGFVKETWQSARRGMLGALTREQLADVHGDLFTRLSDVIPDDPNAADNSNEAKNPLLRYNDFVNRKDAEVTRQHNRGYKYQRAVAELSKTNPKEYEKMADLAIDSTRYEVWPSRKFDDPEGKNHHLKYTTKKDAGTGKYVEHRPEVVSARAAAHDRVSQKYKALDGGTKKIFDETTTFFEEEWEQDALSITENILDLFDIAEYGRDEDGVRVGDPTPVQPGSKGAISKHMMEGSSDSLLEAYAVTTTDADGHTTVDEKTTRALQSQLADMRHRAKVRGPYFPLKRDGNYVVEAKGAETTISVNYADFDTAELRSKAHKWVKRKNVKMHSIMSQDSINEAYKEKYTALLRKAARDKYYELRGNVKEGDRDVKFDAMQDDGKTLSGVYYDYAVEFHRSEALAEESRQAFVAEGMTAPDVRLKHQASNMRGISGDLKSRIEAKLGSDNANLINTLNMAMLEMLPETSIHKATLKRQGIQGASQDLVWSMASHVNAHGYYRGHLKFGAKISDAIRDMRTITDSKMEGEDQRTKFKVAEIASEIKAREDADLSVERDSTVAKLAQAATSVGFIQYLLSTSYSMVNATQPTLLALPWLAAQQHRVKGAKGSASKALGAAYSALSPTIVKRMARVGGGLGFVRGKAVAAEAFDFLTLGESTIGEGLQKSIRESDLQDPEGVIKMLNELGENGKITMTFAADMKGEANKTRFEGSVARGAQELGGAAMDWARIMPHLTEILNRSVTATAAYELATGSMGYTHAQAVEFAGEAVDKTQFNYSPSNKARLMSRAGPLGEATKVVTQFMQHPQHVYFLMVRNAYLSVSSIRKLATNGKNMTPAEREQAMADVRTASRTIGYVTATHMLAAGVVGGMFEPALMAAGMAYKAFMAAFGEDDEDVEPFELFMRNSLYDGLKSAGMNEADTKTITTLFEKGLPAALGVDISGRVGLRNLFTSGMDNNKEGKEAFQAGLINLLGPTASTVGNFFEAAKFVGQGENLRAAEKVLPKMFRDAVKTYRFNTEGITDIYGNDIKGEFTTAESVINALGFQPTAMTDIYDKRNAIKSKEYRITKRREGYIRDFKRASGPEERAQIMAEIKQFNKMVPKWARISYGDTLKASIKDTQKRSAMGRKEGLYLPRKRRGLLEEGRSY
ncbi:MAG: hypothetical protein DRP64_04080, partial [Verrucomicrobia bacterium]